MITISENTKNYIKTVLSEAGGPRGKQHFSPKPGNVGVTGPADPGTAGGMYSPHVSDNEELLRKKRKEGKKYGLGMVLDKDILAGRTELGNNQDIMNYISQISQGYATAEYLDSVMPAAAKALMASQLLGKSPGVKPGSGGMGAPSAADLEATGLDKNTSKLVTNYLKQNAASGPSSGSAPASTSSPSGTATPGGKGASARQPTSQEKAKDNKDKFVSLTKSFAQNLSSLDPFNPLMGIKLGYELLGGKEILKRTRELGAAQSAGVQSSMGHPSAIGRF